MTALTFINRAVVSLAIDAPVIRLHPHDKTPIDSNWTSLATTDMKTIYRWDQASADANVGVVAQGRIGGIWFLEQDTPPPGVSSVTERIETETGQKIPSTFRVQSQKGREHYYWKQTTESIAMGNIAQPYVKHADFSVRVNNQYCVGALSIHPKTNKPYEILLDVPVAEAPNWLIEWIKAQRVEAKKAATDDGVSPIPDGQRNSTLAHIAGKLRGIRLSREGIEDHLSKINSERCIPPLTDQDVAVIAASIARYPAGHPENDLVLVGGVPAGTATTSQAAAVQTKSSELSLVRGSEVKPGSQKWLWLNRIPADTITGLVGEPDKGKSLITNDIAARLTTGRAFPDGAPNPFGGPVEVLMLVAEDSLNTTAVPRLMQAGADLSKIHFVDSVTLNGSKREVALDTDLPVIRRTLERNTKIRLVIVDTVTSYTGNANQYSSFTRRW
ncbi:MAG TPA: bifunctional DNA primase/polymerase [Candidatus Acidoferrales bacterium]|nr:bifunctional DNA primase/polymerase [Candidatus Acidoferrales bacterium]